MIESEKYVWIKTTPSTFWHRMWLSNARYCFTNKSGTQIFKDCAAMGDVIGKITKKYHWVLTHSYRRLG